MPTPHVGMVSVIYALYSLHTFMDVAYFHRAVSQIYGTIETNDALPGTLVPPGVSE